MQQQKKIGKDLQLKKGEIFWFGLNQVEPDPQGRKTGWVGSGLGRGLVSVGVGVEVGSARLDVKSGRG